MSRAERIRIQRLIRRLGRLEDAGAREQARLLRVLRREILAEIATATGFEGFRLQQLLAAVDRFVAVGRAAAERTAAASAGQSWALGLEMAAAAIATPGEPLLAGLSHALLDALLETLRDDVRRVWSELGSRLKSTIRRVTLGVDNVGEAITRLARVIRDPKTFGTPLARAEAIVRTEVNRTFSAAQQARLEQASKAVRAVPGPVDEIRKWWLTAEDHRVRPDHVEAGARYSRENAIPVSQPFIVGGEKLMHPLDPRGSAAQTINCRCVSVPVVVEV